MDASNNNSAHLFQRGVEACNPKTPAEEYEKKGGHTL